DVVTRADDHVVGPRLIVEIAVRIAHVDVAGDVPAVSNVRLLAVAPKVAAACRPLYRQPSQPSVGHWPAVRILDLRHLSRHGAPGAPGPDLVAGGGDEDVQHLRRPNAVDDANHACIVAGLPG